MLFIDFIKKIFGTQKQEASETNGSFENSLIDLSYEFNHITGELSIYLYFDLDVDVYEVTIVPISDYELAILSKNKGVIGLLRIKKKYYRNSIEIEKKQKTIKLKVLLKK